VANVKREQVAQITFLGFDTPTYVGFPGIKREFVATITFLDLTEQALESLIQAAEASVLFSDSVNITVTELHTLIWDSGKWDQDLWG